MKIDVNDILECINKTLELERRYLGIEGKGHFVYKSSYHRNIGHIKTFIIDIFFIDKDMNPINIISINHTEACPNEKLDEVIGKLTLKALENLFIVLRVGQDKYKYDNFLRGSLDGD